MTPLPPDAQRKLEQLDPELRELVAACYPTPEHEAEAAELDRRRHAAATAREAIALNQLADKVLAGEHGPEAKAAAIRILDPASGGRSYVNLSTLRSTVRRLR